jgi:hypothetical protein
VVMGHSIMRRAISPRSRRISLGCELSRFDRFVSTWRDPVKSVRPTDQEPAAEMVHEAGAQSLRCLTWNGCCRRRLIYFTANF